MTAPQWFALLLLSLLWGGSFFFVEILLTALPPLTIVTLRVALAALVLWPLVFARGIGAPPSAKAWGELALMGLLNNVIPFSLIVWGQTGISSGLAAILNATTPVFTVIVAGLLLADERFSTAKIVGVGLGVLGTVIMIGPAAMFESDQSVLAQLAILGAALSYGFAGVYGRRFARQGVKPLRVAAGQVTCSALLLAPFAWVIEAPADLTLPGLGIWVTLLALAVLSTALAYQLYFVLLASAGATNTSLVTILVPVSAIVLGAVFLNEQLSGEHVAGMAVIALGLVVIDGRWPRRRPAPRG